MPPSLIILPGSLTTTSNLIVSPSNCIVVEQLYRRRTKVSSSCDRVVVVRSRRRRAIASSPGYRVVAVRSHRRTRYRRVNTIVSLRGISAYFTYIFIILHAYLIIFHSSSRFTLILLSYIAI